MRINRDQMWMLMTEAAARRATCRRLNVGALLVHDNDVVSVGYNGPPAGEPHCHGDCGRPTCSRAVHAEFNAIVRAADKGFTCFDTSTLYITNSPCERCFNVIRAYRIPRVVFRDEYRIDDHLKDQTHGIQVEKITPSGYLTDFVTGRLIGEP